MKLSDITEPITCTVGELAALLKIDADSVGRLVRKGVGKKAGHGRYMLIETLAEIAIHRGRGVESEEPTEGGADYERERARLYKARANIAEREDNLAAGKVFHADAVAAAFGPMLSNFRTRALAIPSRTAPLVADLSVADECYAVIEEAVREALTEMADYDPAPIAERQREMLGQEILRRDALEEEVPEPPPAK